MYIKKIKKETKNEYYYELIRLFISFVIKVIMSGILFFLFFTFFNVKELYDFFVANCLLLIELIIIIICFLMRITIFYYIDIFAYTTGLFIAYNFSGLIFGYFVICKELINIVKNYAIYCIYILIFILYCLYFYKKTNLIIKRFSKQEPRDKYKIKKNIENFDEFFSNNQKRSLLIVGGWGVGKTYQITTQWLRHQLYGLKLYFNDYKYISLIGINDFNSLCKLILYSINSIDDIEIKNKELTRYNNIYINYSILDLIYIIVKKYIGITMTSEIVLSQLIKNKYKDIAKNKILIIDDLERTDKNIDVVRLLGLIHLISSNFKKIIVICNVENMDGKQKEYLDKNYEKIFNECIEISNPSIELIYNKLNDIYNKEDIEILDLEYVKNLRICNDIHELFISNKELLYKYSNIEITERYKKLLKMKLLIFEMLYYKYHCFSENDFSKIMSDKEIQIICEKYNVKKLIEIDGKYFLYELLKRKALFCSIETKYLITLFDAALIAIKTKNLEAFLKYEINFIENPLKTIRYITNNVNELNQKKEDYLNKLNSDDYNHVSVSLDFFNNAIKLNVCKDSANFHQIIKHCIDIVCAEMINDKYKYSDLRERIKKWETNLHSKISFNETDKYIYETLCFEFENKIFIDDPTNKYFNFNKYYNLLLLYSKFNLVHFKGSTNRYIDYNKNLIDNITENVDRKLLNNKNSIYGKVLFEISSYFTNNVYIDETNELKKYINNKLGITFIR